MYYPKAKYIHVGFEKATKKGKQYNAILKNKDTQRLTKVPFGSMMQNYHDKTGLNLYPHLIHGDAKRRKSFRAHKGYLKRGFYSPSHFSYYFLW